VLHWNIIESVEAKELKAASPLAADLHCRLEGLQHRTAAKHNALSQELVERDREIADTDAGRVINGIGDGGSGTDNPNLTNAFRAHRVDVRIVFVDP
jgi:hypothetical protein